MNSLEQYAESFRRGLYQFLYTDEGNRQMPMMNKGSLASIGYYDGYQYGEYLEITGQTDKKENYLSFLYHFPMFFIIILHLFSFSNIC